jgi:hypothetical protein
LQKHRIGISRDLLALLVTVYLYGCGPSNSAARYVPSESVARQALEAALTAWQKGSGTSLSLDNNTTIEVIDRERRAGQTLTEFKILGEVSVEGGRWFEVEMRLDHPAQIEQVRYCVIGINPLWVFRQSDYEVLGHWDHPMPGNVTGKSTQSTVTAEKSDEAL